MEANTGSVVGAVGGAWRSRIVMILPAHLDGTTNQDQLPTRIRTAMTRLKMRQWRPNGAGLKRTARRLRVHTNTVPYRIQRTEQLSQLDVTDPDDRLLTHISIKIIEADTTNARESDQLSDAQCQ